MELTKEYFDKQLDKRLKNLITKEDLKDFAKKSDLERFATKEDLRNFVTKDDLKNFATKDDLKAQTKELKQYAEEQSEFLARIVAKTVANPLEKLIQETKDQKLNSRVTSLESDMKRIKKSLLVD